jgi:hypothetical protein
VNLRVKNNYDKLKINKNKIFFKMAKAKKVAKKKTVAKKKPGAKKTSAVRSKKNIKKQPKGYAESIVSETIFDSKVGNTDALFVSTPEPVQTPPVVQEKQSLWQKIRNFFKE